MRNRWIVCFAVGALVAVSGSAWAQQPRYELGRRLRAMERAWDRQPDPAVRAAASKHLQQAVRDFFALRLLGASQALDAAALMLRAGAGEPTTTERWAASLDVVPEYRLFDTSRQTLRITIRPAYAATAPIIDRLGVHLSMAGGDPTGAAAPQAFEIATKDLPLTLDFALPRLPEGDATLMAAFYAGKAFVGRAEVGVSEVERLDERLASARATLLAWDEQAAPPGLEMEKLTARGLLGQLEALAGGSPLETDVPAARRLALLERVLARAAAGERLRGGDASGDVWLTYESGGRPVIVRQWTPEDLADDGKRPLVIAMHGAGGSENMFFDGHGNGAVVRLCRKRGWIVVAPRGGWGGAARLTGLIDAIAERFPVDRDRVFLVGHSMGAAQAVSAAGAAPRRIAAVAALGGGGRPGRTTDELKRLPFFVGVGSADFSKPIAVDLKNALERAEVDRVEFREYADIEHLAIVQVALPDVFAFFDTELARRQPRVAD